MVSFYVFLALIGTDPMLRTRVAHDAPISESQGRATDKTPY